MMSRSPFEETDALVRAFARYPRFIPNTFVAFAEPKRASEADDYAPGTLMRSFRYELGGCQSHVMATGSPQSSWRRAIGEHLVRAGYERWLTGRDDEDFVRWLPSVRHQVAELRFLRHLGETGAIQQGARSPRRHLEKRKSVAPVLSRFLAAIERARHCGVAWTDCSMGFVRTRPRGARPSLRIGAIVYGPRRIGVYANLVSASLVGGSGAPSFSDDLCDHARTLLRDSGFNECGEPRRGQLHYQHEEERASVAARLCAATFDALNLALTEARLPKRGG
jgi:hypothetical protein